MADRRPYANGVLGGTPLEAARLNAEQADLRASLSQLAADPSMLFSGAVTRDADGAPISAVVRWPDGSAGTYAGTASLTWPGAVSAYTVTKSGASTLTFTQPAVTRDASGNVTNRPAIVYTSDNANDYINPDPANPVDLDAALVGKIGDAASGTRAALNDTYATASRTKYAALNDRSVFSPGGALTFAWNFLPLAEPGTHYGQCILREADGKYRLYSVYSRANLGMIHLAEPIFGIPGDSVYDSNLLVLPNGKFVMACHSGDQGSIHFFTSTDKGSTWTAQQVVNPGDPYVTRRRFSEVHMIRVQLGSPYTGSSYRIIAAWCDIDPVFPVSRDTQYVTAFSDDEGVTWSAPVIVTPTSGAGSAGIVNDNTRPWLYQGVDGKINLLYSRAVEISGKTYGSIMHTQLSGDGMTVVTSPVKVIDCPYSVGSMARPDHPGAGPAVFEGRDGKFHLVWSESNYADYDTDGVINIMSGAGGPTDWAGKTTLIHRQDAPNGFGRVQPTRVGDSVEVIYGFVNTPTSTQMRSLTLSGL